MPHDVVLQRGVEQMVAVEIEAAPFHRRLSRPLQEIACCIAEELRDVHALDLPLRSGPCAAPAGRETVAEEVGEEVVEEASAAEAARHLLLGVVDLAEVFDFLRSVRTKPDPRRDCRSTVT